MSYHATDDDLPEIFWPGGKAPELSPVDTAKRAQMAVQRHYAPVEQSGSERRYARAVESERRTVARELDADRKHYVRGKKCEQMHEWFEALAVQKAQLRMTPYEQRFFADLLGRFQAWYPRVKWITQKQYGFLRQIAARYLALPDCDEKRAA